MADLYVFATYRYMQFQGMAKTRFAALIGQLPQPLQDLGALGIVDSSFH
jgi:hypothetical protein